MHILIYTCIYVHILCDLKNSCIHAHTCPYLHIRTIHIRTHTSYVQHTCIYLHIHTNTCTYGLKYVHVFARKWSTYMHVCCTYIVPYLHVHARIARICTYFLYGKLLGASMYVYLHILAYTYKYLRIYVQIRAYMHAYTCKTLRTQSGFQDSIFTYMHVYARIFQHDTLIWTYMNIHSIWTYMHVYARI